MENHEDDEKLIQGFDKNANLDIDSGNKSCNKKKIIIIVSAIVLLIVVVVIVLVFTVFKKNLTQIKIQTQIQVLMNLLIKEKMTKMIQLKVFLIQYHKKKWIKQEMLLNNVKKAVDLFSENKIVIAGGVSRNSYIRNAFDNFAKENNINVYYPEPILCTDNAAMIASSGYYNYINGERADLRLNAVPNLKIGE